MTTPHDQAIREAAEKIERLSERYNIDGGFTGIRKEEAESILRDLVAKVGGEAAEKLRALTDPNIELNSDFCGRCAVCGCDESYTYHVPEALWRRVLPESLWNKVVCAGCFHEAATGNRIRAQLTAAQDEVKRLRAERDRAVAQCDLAARVLVGDDGDTTLAETVVATQIRNEQLGRENTTLRAAAEQAKGALEGHEKAESASIEQILLGETPDRDVMRRQALALNRSALTALSAALDARQSTEGREG